MLVPPPHQHHLVAVEEGCPAEFFPGSHSASYLRVDEAAVTAYDLSKKLEMENIVESVSSGDALMGRIRHALDSALL